MNAETFRIPEWIKPGATLYIKNHKFGGILRESKVISYDDYWFTITIIRPALTSTAVSAFLFLPSQVLAKDCMFVEEKVVSELVQTSGQAAVIISNPLSAKGFLPVFETFAAMKWLKNYGCEIGINATRIAIIGAQLGANVAIVLSLMALSDDFPSISLQILIDPQFYISEKHHSGRYFRRSDSNKSVCDRDWINMKSIFDFPFESRTNELAGLPPTLVQLSGNARIQCELDYYCALLLNAGNQVTYTNYEDAAIFPPVPWLSRILLTNTAAELKKFAP